MSEERARATYWKMSTESYHIMKDARPNRAHLAVKTLETMGKLLAVVTQNIDRLHHKAGNSPDRIIEIHGTLFSVSCLSCGKTYDRDDIDDRITSGVDVPTCDDCGGILKPDTISFGQAMPEDKMAKSFTLARECDLCMALGSSLVVYPAASIPSVALESGAKLMIINRDETPLDPEADVVVHGSLSEVLGDMVQASK